jgi:phosphohistidine phosphatase
MDLILWRHAEAEEHADELRRRLTTKGRKQAQRAAEWLLHRLPARFMLISSPAVRAHQTAQALGVPIKVERAVVIVGHQPDQVVVRAVVSADLL